MGNTSALSLALLTGCTLVISLHAAFSQNSRVEWSSVSSGFGSQASATSRVSSSAGGEMVGVSLLANTEIESGFMAGLLSFGTTVAVPERSSGIPVAFALSQNYPNPFNPTTTIRYAVPYRSHTSLIVYNTLGQKVAELVNGDIDAGFHEIRFMGTNLASGVYFYRLQAGSFVDVKKLVLCK